MKRSVEGNNSTVDMTERISISMPDLDKHTAYIELSNKCREFYQARMKSAEVMKEKLNSNINRTNGKKNSIDTAMETLRAEMSSLMDQDLSLMKQLLTLNETIEELKWQQRHYHSRSSIAESSCDLTNSDWSVSETDMYESENDSLQKYPTPSALSLHSWLSKRENSEEHQCESDEKTVQVKSCSNNNQCDTYKGHPLVTSRKFIEAEFLVRCNIKECFEENNSFDSGIYESARAKEITV
ncbi:hypothetical protein CHS0354_029199 [Potamilus streckersoni]|uniref:Uncharacterized protein n=1 Tax=Potamilus streckersoni TaxID=2493646 RepID=A0AAE0WDV1_9BIVA|nr:hypothetical protein CHS0354_029199 [Potamilus streckersoni]